MSEAQPPLVSVIVPAYNAEQTLDATLRSVRNQTHRALEIIVVVGGATDRTEAVARTHAAEDDRIVVILSENLGVIGHRNLGAARSHGAYIAPIDADDLWHPEKTARQLAVFQAQGPDVGCVYSANRRIDAEDRVMRSSEPGPEGRMFLRSLLVNYVDNGSAAMFRREAFESVGGYQGHAWVSDHLIVIMISRRWLIGMAPGYLIGYRRLPGSMSMKYETMFQARMEMLQFIAQRYPETPAGVLRACEAAVLVWVAAIRLRYGRLLTGTKCLLAALRRAPLVTLDAFPFALRDLLTARLQRFRARRDPDGTALFLDLDPDADARQDPGPSLRWLLKRLEAEDQVFFDTPSS